jgi:deazaflavin-dependent oxidoreductase (nitroreductase family)
MTMWYNPIMMWILRSPLHGMLSGSTMIITYTGRKSGKTFSTPVNYVRDGDVLWTISFRQRTWWRNLHDSPVTVRIQGKDFPGVGQAITDQQEVADCLMAYLRKAPQIAKYIGVALDASGQPRQEDVANAAQTRVMVRVRLSEN